MEQAREDQDNVIYFDRPSCEWAKLIRKLRWIGLDEEARRLALAVSTLPPEERDRGSVSVGPSAPTRCASGDRGEG
jgi:hypothetical protein